MTRKLKALGLALLAVFALGAVAASSASAETTDHFTSEIADTFITGTQIGKGAEGAWNIFNTKGVNFPVSCEKAVYTGTMLNNNATSLTLHPKYEECKAGGFKVTVDVAAGCNFILTSTTDKYFNTEGKEEGKDATVSLECNKPAEEDISITVEGGCTITMSAEHGGVKVNQNLLGVTYQNTGLGATRDVDAKVTVDKIHYTAKGFACMLVGFSKETNTDAFLTQTVTVKGFSDSAHTKQVGIEVS
jgi:hypothetical protein